MKTLKKLIPFLVAVVAVCAVGFLMYTSADATAFSCTTPSSRPSPPNPTSGNLWITNMNSYQYSTMQALFYNNDQLEEATSQYTLTALTHVYILNYNQSKQTIDVSIISPSGELDKNELILNPNGYYVLCCSEDLEFMSLSKSGENKWALKFRVPGDYSTSEQPKKPYTDALENNIKSLAALIKAGEVTDNNITWSEGQALPASVMDILKDNPTVTLTFNFDYLGNSYSITVKGSDVIDLGDDVDWYGPECLIRYYGSLWDKVNLAISKAK